MARLTRAYPWADTPLGAIEFWSESLLCQVNLLLQCPLPATLSLGSSLVFLYNDATIPTLSRKHPSALGRTYKDVFPEAWHLVKDDLERCLLGQTATREDVLIPLDREGQVQPFYWTYSLTPVYEGQTIIGVFNTYQNTTESVALKRDNEALTQRLTQVLDSTSDAIVSLDRDWVITYMNPRARSLFAPNGSVIGLVAWDAYPHQVYPGSPFVEHYERAMYERVEGEFEAFYPEPLNLWLAIQVRPAPDGIVTFTRDVTERKNTDDALCTSNEHLRQAQEAGRIATWNWNLKTNEVVWSGDTAAIYGRPASEITPIERVLSYFHDEDRVAGEKAIRDPLNGLADYSHEFRSVWPDGSTHWNLAQGRPLYSRTGEATHMAGIVLDITERKTIQQKILTERNNLASLFEQAPAFIAVLSGPEHIYEMVNQAHEDLVGFRDCIGKRPIDVHTSPTGFEMTKILDRVYETGIPHIDHNGFLRIRRGPDQPLQNAYVDYVFQPRRDAEGNVCGIIALGVDRTERWRTQKALIQTEKLAAVGRLASSIAHEINNPLAAVTNFLYLAAVSTDLSEIREYLSIIENELRRVAVISNHTLLSQKRSVIPGYVKLDELTDSVLFLYSGRARNHEIAVETTHRTQPPVLCLEGEIRQVLGNIIANALEAMSSGGGRLVIRSRLGTDWSNGMSVHKIIVADTGSGIDPSLIHRIQEPFFTTKGADGNGLGLWVCQEIINRHKGRLLVRSRTRQPGTGTVFVLYLPTQP